MKKILNNKIFKIIYGIIKYAFLTVLVLYLLFMAYQRFFSKSIGGYRIYTIVSESMKPVYEIGDVILIKEEKNYKVGDIITYKAVVLGQDSTITHRIIKIDGNEITTKGDANEVEDNPITTDKVLGKSVTKLGLFSLITKLIKNKFIFYFIVFVPIVVISFLEVADLVLSHKKDDEDE